MEIVLDNEISTTYSARINGKVYLGREYKDDGTRVLDMPQGGGMYGSLLDDYRQEHQEIWRKFWSKIDELN